MKAIAAIILLGAVPAVLSAQAQRTPAEGCGRADPAYILTANETGGIPMFLQRSEAAKSFHLVRESTRNNVSTVVWASGVLDQPQSIDLPVDSTTQRLTVAVSFDMDGGSATILSPSRAAITPGSSNSEVTELRCGRIVTAVSPEAGTWRVELSGKGRFWIEAQAQSDIHFVTAEFVREGGRPGHEGLFRIDGQPVAGKPGTLRASLSTAGARSSEFYLAGERGELLQQLSMRPIGGGEFLGTVDLPNVPFRVAVKGIDSNGRPYQRFYSHLFHAESLEVSWSGTVEDLAAGSDRQIEFTIRNSGPARTVKLTVTDARQFIKRVQPNELTLANGQTGKILVDLSVPAGTPPGTGDDVIVVATGAAGPSTSNSVVAHLSVR